MVIRPMKKIFSPVISVDTEKLEHLRFLIANALLVTTLATLSFFALNHVLLDQKYLIAGLELFAALFSLYALVELRSKLRLSLASLLGTINLVVFLVLFTIANQGENFGLIWCLSVPLYAIFLNGRKTGLIITVSFYLMLFSLAYDGIGTWQEGRWGILGFMRLVSASLIMTFVIYFVTLILEQAYAQIEEARRYDEEQRMRLQQLSITDPLTGLYNRRYLDHAFAHELNHAKRNGYSLALFVMDLDRFKEFNDIYGHQQGDDALVRVGEVLRKTLRRSEDYLFRIGGEEFCGILTDKEGRGVFSAVEQVRAAVEALEIPHSANTGTGTLTASIGICLIENVSTETFDVMYKKADEALYAAKKEGRNRMVIA
jgi:diguanylate cyclase (GGDEF)-like protein